MTIAEEYLTKLQEREPELFQAPLQKSVLTDADLLEIEESLGHPLPEQYREFLQSYQLPDVTVYITFCGDAYANSFSDTFSREENKYVPVDWDNARSTTVDMKWHNQSASNAADWLRQLEEEEHDGNNSAFRRAGYLYLGMFYESYYVLYDLIEGEVVTIHHEAIYDISYELGIDDWDDMNPKALRTGMETWGDTFCKDFNDFLRLVCLGEYYDEDDMAFVKEEDL